MAPQFGQEIRIVSPLLSQLRTLPTAPLAATPPAAPNAITARIGNGMSGSEQIALDLKRVEVDLQHAPKVAQAIRVDPGGLTEFKQ